MADVQRLLSQYIDEHRAGGEADPLAYLEQLEGVDRAELELLIDEYLQRSPGRPWDPEAFQGSSAEILADRLTRAFGGEGGSWPVVLPRLRERARLARAELARRLADSLGVAGKEEKVEEYLHEMERGTLPADGVAPTVTERLAAILETSAEHLRHAGRSLAGPAPPASPGTVFARTAEVHEQAAMRSPGEAQAERTGEDWDEVDELFRGAGR